MFRSTKLSSTVQNFSFMNKRKNIVGVEAVDRALNILNCFKNINYPISLTEVSKLTNNHKSTTSRLIKSLEKYNYILKDQNGKYSIGHSINQIKENYKDHMVWQDLVLQQLERLTKISNETALFFVKQKNLRICILKSEPNIPVRHSIETGVPKIFGVGSSGKILSAYSGLKVKNKDKILKNGYVIVFNEVPDLASVSVPLIKKNGELLGSITLTGPSVRLSKKKCLYYVSELKTSASKIRNELTN